MKSALASALAAYVRLVKWSNRPVAGSADIAEAARTHGPSIYALWHGQHLVGPAINPAGRPMMTIVSRSADAELNALVAEKLGLAVVRGSAARNQGQTLEKGGARALLSMKRALDAGGSVSMLADPSRETVRQVSAGVVALARLSGCPIVPLAYATSRRKTIARSWDKMVINLPFGRSALIFGDPVTVPPDANAAELEAKRREATAALEAATRRAYALVDGTA